MNSSEELLSLYEKIKSEVGRIYYRKYGNKEKDWVSYVLPPLYHTTVTAQIEVVIDENGDFLSAEPIANSDKMTIIPITEKSASRTSGKESHPLCDSLKYVAGDYSHYVKNKQDDIGDYFQLYMEGLQQWNKSEFTHKKVDAIYTYLCKKTLIHDLINEKVLEADKEGWLSDKKIQNIPQENALVRFTVRCVGGETFNECWRDPTLWDCFIAYSRFLQKEKCLDYLSGTLDVPSYLHPSKIRNEGDRAKLISANDEANFTFKGRFLTKEQAVIIGYESSQKIHNALKWIIRKQGYSYDTMTIVAWESDLVSMPLWSSDTEQIVSEAEAEEKEDLPEELFEETFVMDMKPSKMKMADTNMITAAEFSQALDGYRKNVHQTSRMVLMALDAATTGRLALVEYTTLDTSRYLENIKRWHSQCEWFHTKQSQGRVKHFWGMVGVKDIVEILYSTETKKGVLTVSNKKLYKNVAQRLLPCIWNGSRLPYDFVSLAVRKASSPLAYKDQSTWERVLSLACSFVKKYRFDHKREEWKLALDKTCTDRSYLYGRLLAVADRIEYRTYDKDKDSGRITNAKRYMSTFAQRPFETWKIIEENLQPYQGKLRIKERNYYAEVRDQINYLFDIKSYSDNTPLDGLYLLGFHSQSFALKRFAEDTDEIEGAE